jgi:DNA-directed RNA polymerase subunit RPC12/RpoP
MKKYLPPKNKNIHQNQQLHTHNTQQTSYLCPSCQQVITFQQEISKDITVNCPQCGKKGIIRPNEKKQNNTNTKISPPNRNEAHIIDERKNINIPTIEVKILGLLLIIIGIALQFVFNIFSPKISFALIIIGMIIYAFIPDTRIIFIKFFRKKNKEKQQNTGNNQKKLPKYFSYTYLNTQIHISEKIAMVLILWIILIYTLTGVNNIDIFFIFTYLGVLIMKVISTEYISPQLKQKINVFTIAFLFIFIIIIIRRIFTIIPI